MRLNFLLLFIPLLANVKSEARAQSGDADNKRHYNTWDDRISHPSHKIPRPIPRPSLIETLKPQTTTVASETWSTIHPFESITITQPLVPEPSIKPEEAVSPPKPSPSNPLRPPIKPLPHTTHKPVSPIRPNNPYHQRPLLPKRPIPRPISRPVPIDTTTIIEHPTWGTEVTKPEPVIVVSEHTPAIRPSLNRPGYHPNLGPIRPSRPIPRPTISSGPTLVPSETVRPAIVIPETPTDKGSAVIGTVDSSEHNSNGLKTVPEEEPEPSKPGYGQDLIEPEPKPTLSASTTTVASMIKPAPEPPMRETVVPPIPTRVPIYITHPTPVPPTVAIPTIINHPIPILPHKIDENKQILMDYNCKQINAYYAFANECDTYVECKKNIAVRYLCPDGLHFNPNALWPEYPCAYPTEVRCDSRSVIQNPQPTSQCPRQFGYFPMADGDCGRYLMCQEGLARVMSCPRGLAFNPDKSSCDWPENVPSCNLNVFQGLTCPAPPLDEDGLPSDEILKYRYGKSCKEYVACQRGHPRLLSCDPGLYFDEASQVCVDSDYVNDCKAFIN